MPAWQNRCEFMAFATPQCWLPSCHYFAPKAISALRQHVKCNASVSPDNAINCKVHMTTWSIKPRDRDTTYPAWHIGSIFWLLGRMQNVASPCILLNDESTITFPLASSSYSLEPAVPPKFPRVYVLLKTNAFACCSLYAWQTGAKLGQSCEQLFRPRQRSDWPHTIFSQVLLCVTKTLPFARVAHVITWVVPVDCEVPWLPGGPSSDQNCLWPP